MFASGDGGDSWSQVVKLAASDGASGDRYGTSASIYGNYLAIGAFSDDYDSLVNAGQFLLMLYYFPVEF